MSKWADYLISKVEYNNAGTHITKVLAHADKGDSVGAGEEMYRLNVVGLLDKKYTFMTIYKNSSDQ